MDWNYVSCSMPTTVHLPNYNNANIVSYSTLFREKSTTNWRCLHPQFCNSLIFEFDSEWNALAWCTEKNWWKTLWCKGSMTLFCTSIKFLFHCYLLHLHHAIFDRILKLPFCQENHSNRTTKTPIYSLTRQPRSQYNLLIRLQAYIVISLDQFIVQFVVCILHS